MAVLLLILSAGLMAESATGTGFVILLAAAAALVLISGIELPDKLEKAGGFVGILCVVILERLSQFAVSPYFPLIYIYLVFHKAYGYKWSVARQGRSDAAAGNDLGLEPGRQLSGLWITVLVIGASLKYVEILRRDPSFFDPGTALLSLALLAAVAVALRYAQVYRSERDELERLSKEIESLTASKEQKRISRELHDTLGHALTGHIMRLEIADHYLQAERSSEALSQIEAAKEEGRVMLRTVQEIVTALREPVWAQEDFEALIKESSLSGLLKAELKVIGNLGGLSPEVNHVLYRAVQESLTNARRHSNATQIDLLIEADLGQGIRFVVEDNGTAAPESVNPGNGLRGMRERAEALGGSMICSRSAAGGFRIELTIPV
jgi:signal transduction histidine kinase